MYGAQQRRDEYQEEIEDRNDWKCRRGSPSINALVETIEGVIGGRALVVMKSELGARGLAEEAPIPTYGYLRKDGFL